MKSIFSLGGIGIVSHQLRYIDACFAFEEILNIDSMNIEY